MHPTPREEKGKIGSKFQFLKNNLCPYNEPVPLEHDSPEVTGIKPSDTVKPHLVQGLLKARAGHTFFSHDSMMNSESSFF